MVFIFSFIIIIYLLLKEISKDIDHSNDYVHSNKKTLSKKAF